MKNDRDRDNAGMNEELERLRRRISELELRAAEDERSDEELRATLLRQNAILNNIPDIAWLKDTEGRYIAVNGPYGQASGVPPAAVVGKTDLDIWPRDLAEGYRAGDADVMRSKKRKRVEERFIGQDGREQWIETIKTPILDDQGSVLGTAGIARDITERRQAEAKLRYVTRLYAFLIQIGQAIVRTRARGELFRAMCRIAIDFGQFRMAWIGLIDEADGIVRPVTHAGQEDGYLNSLAIRIDDEATCKGPTGSALREGSLVICDDIATDPRMLSWRDEALKRGYRSSAAIPLRQKGIVIGSLNLYAAESGFFTEDERKLLTEIGVDISFALDALEGERERRQAEEALLESKERYRSFFDNATVAVAIVDQGGHVVEANDADCRFLGYPRSELVGMHFTRFTHPQDMDLDVALYQAMLSGQRKGYEIEKRYVRKDGDVVWGRLAVSLIRDSQGVPIYTLVVCVDITERKRMEEALRESEEQYRAIFDGIGDAVFVHRHAEEGPTGRFIAVNDVACRHLGYTREELLALSLPQVDPLDAAVIPSVLESLRAGREALFETVHITKEGRRVPVEVHARIIPYLGAPAVLSVARDIADRKRAQEDLRHRTRGLATLLEVSKGLAATLNREEVLQTTTDGVTKLFGLHTAAVYLLEGDSLRLWATTPPLPPNFPEELRNAPVADHPLIREALASGTPVHVYDMVTAKLSPEERSAAEQRDLRTVLYFPLIAGVKSVGTLIVGSVGKPQVISEADIDLCRTLANLAALAVENARLYTSGRQYASELEQQIAGRKKAEGKRLELERRLLHAQKLESLGVLAGGIAHDFNNLLMAVLGNLDLALRKVSPDSPARLNIEQSVQAARRATDLTRQMLAYSGKGSFIVKAMDLSEVVEENTHLFRSSVARTATLDVRLGRSLPSIEADAGQVQQVIMNLITNASEAIGGASGRITITTGAQECDAQCLKRSRSEDAPPPGKFVYLEVSDTGCGMDEQTKQRLFDPFFTTKAPGRGLGMSAILGIVRGHRGAIFVESSPGRGTSIRIVFPAFEGRRAESGAPASVRVEAGAHAVGGKVLVVDDEEIVRMVCRDMVEALGLPVLTAVDGRNAVDLFAKHADEIAIVILDLSMPNMDGMTAFQELIRIRPGVKVILSSGYDESDTIKRLSGQGLAGFIQKPYSLNNLRDVLENAGRGGG